MPTTILHITGMRTVHCARAIFAALAGVEGALAAEVTVGRAEVEHDGRATREALEDAVALAGYAVSRVETGGRSLPVL